MGPKPTRQGRPTKTAAAGKATRATTKATKAAAAATAEAETSDLIPTAVDIPSSPPVRRALFPSVQPYVPPPLHGNSLSSGEEFESISPDSEIEPAAPPPPSGPVVEVSPIKRRERRVAPNLTKLSDMKVPDRTNVRERSRYRTPIPRLLIYRLIITDYHPESNPTHTLATPPSFTTALITDPAPPFPNVRATCRDHDGAPT